MVTVLGEVITQVDMLLAVLALLVLIFLFKVLCRINLYSKSIKLL
jgi:hypothetical protein